MDVKILTELLESNYFNLLIDHEVVDFTKKSHLKALKKTLQAAGLTELESRKLVIEVEKNTRSKEDTEQIQKDAESKGVKHIAYGFYGKNGKVMYKSEDGKLVPTSDLEYQKAVSKNAKIDKGGDQVEPTAGAGQPPGEEVKPKYIDPDSAKGKELAKKGNVAGELYHNAKKSEDGDNSDGTKPTLKNTDEITEFLSPDEIESFNKLLDQNVNSNSSFKDTVFILRAKLFAMANGSKVTLTPHEVSEMSKLAISANRASNQIYHMDYGVRRKAITSTNSRSMGFDPTSAKGIKNYIISNWDNVLKELERQNKDQFAPRFKKGGTISSTPPEVDRIPFDFKPQMLLGNMKESDVGSMYSDNQIKLGGSLADLSGMSVYGERLNSNDKSTHSKAIMNITNSIRKSVVSAEPSTQKYMKKLLDGISDTLTKSDNAEDNLKELKEKLPALLTEAYDSAVELDDKEAASFLKDFGEIGVYINKLTEGKEVYMPIEGSYPLADLLELNSAQDGTLYHINNISVKSKKGNTAKLGAASSAKAMFSFMKTVDSGRSDVYDSLMALQTNSITRVPLEKLNNDTLGEVESILSLSNYSNYDSAVKKIKTLLPEDEVTTIETAWARYGSSKKAQLDKLGILSVKSDFDKMNKVFMELVYRQYSMYKIKSVMDKVNLTIPLDYITAEISDGPSSFEIKDYGAPVSSNFVVYDKGYLSEPITNEKGELEAKYLKANLAVSPKF